MIEFGENAVDLLNLSQKAGSRALQATLLRLCV